MKELMPLENINAVAIFSDGGLDKLLEQIHTEAESHVPDLETDKGRKAIASIAAKVAKSKTYLDGLGKDMVAGWKSQAKVVDAERRKMRDDLDELKINIRKPLTDYEDAEKERKDNIQKVINSLIESGNDAVENYLSRDLQTMVDRKSEIESIDTSTGFDELSDSATYFRKEAIEKLDTAIEKRKQHDLDQAELEKLRAEAVERERKEREAQIIKEREEREKQIALEAGEKAEKEKQQAIQDRKDAELRAKQLEEQAIKDKKEAKDRAEFIEKQAIEREKLAIENAEREAREKLEAEKKAEQEAQSKRERNTRHKAKINNEAVDALIKLKLTPDQSRKVVTAIAKGNIPNVTIAY